MLNPCNNEIPFSTDVVSPPLVCWFHCSDNDSAILQGCKKKKKTLLSQHPKGEPPSAIFEKWKYQLEVTRKHTSSLVCKKKKLLLFGRTSRSKKSTLRFDPSKHITISSFKKKCQLQLRPVQKRLITRLTLIKACSQQCSHKEDEHQNGPGLSSEIS